MSNAGPAPKVDVAPTAPLAPAAERVRHALRDAGEADPGADLTVTPLPGGASRDTWIVAGRAGRYVLKRDPPEETAPWTSREREYRSALAAHEAGVPVARPVLYEPAGGRFDSATIVSEWCRGTTSPRRILALHENQASRTALLQDIGRAAGTLSKVNVARAIGTGTNGAPARSTVNCGVADTLDETLAEFTQGLFDLASDRPVMAIALRWLMVNRPSPTAPVLVHGDFRLGNLMVDESGLVALIDWEFCRSGDIATDLGFFCLRPWRFGNDHHRAGGLGDLDPLLEGYGQTSDNAIDRARVRYGEMLGHMWWGLYCLRNSRAYRDGQHHSLQRLVLGRRIAEVEWDLLNLIDEV